MDLEGRLTQEKCPGPFCLQGKTGSSRSRSNSSDPSGPVIGVPEDGWGAACPWALTEVRKGARLLMKPH